MTSMTEQFVDATYFAETIAVEMNALNRYLMRAWSIPAGDERNTVLDLAIQHNRKIEQMIRKGRDVATSVDTTPKKKLDTIKPKKQGKPKADLLPELDD